MKELKSSMILNILRTLNELKRINFGDENQIKISVKETEMLVDCPNKDIRRGIELILDGILGTIVNIKDNYTLIIHLHC